MFSICISCRQTCVRTPKADTKPLRSVGGGRPRSIRCCKVIVILAKGYLRGESRMHDEAADDQAMMSRYGRPVAKDATCTDLSCDALQ